MGIPQDNAATMEIEFKFCIPPDRLAAVQAAVRRGRCVAIRMEARYFDTPDGALASRGIASVSYTHLTLPTTPYV